MKLLICAQAVDSQDPALSFFVLWLREFSKHFDTITVLALRVGEHDLPQNVRVVHLGGSTLGRLVGLWRNSIELRGSYSAVLVHQGQEFALAAGWLWALLGKPMYLWRNHYSGSVLTSIATLFARKVFATSKHSYTARYKKTVLMPVGVDTSLFRPAASRTPRSILFFGRMAPSKHPEVLVEALLRLKQQGVEFSANFYGAALPQDQSFAKKVEARARQALGERVRFHGGVAYTQAPAIFAAHDIFVNLARSGMYDKTLFEAAACGCLVLASSRDFTELAGPLFSFNEADADDLAHKLKGLLACNEIECRESAAKLQNIVEAHSLSVLSAQLAGELS